MTSRNDFQELTACVACASTELTLILDLNEQALANDFQSKIGEGQKYPLAINYCDKCTHMQLTHAVKPEILFSNYLYVSGTTNTLKNYFANFAGKISDRYEAISREGTNRRILDVACNDGTQLDYFKNHGWSTMGIDPAENLFPYSSQNHFVVCDFLNEIHGQFLKADVLLAQNVFAHTENPLKFLKIASEISDIILIQTSQAFMVERNEFDTTYHEHISYFSELSMQKLAERAGMVVTDIEIMPIHGDSFLFTLERKGISREITLNRDRNSVETFAKNAKEILTELDSVIALHKARGRSIVGYGAAAKGMTMLNALESEIDFLVDDSPLKIGKFSPGKFYAVKDIEALRGFESPITIILLAWNFESEIRARIESLKLPNVEFITYFPNVKVSI